MEVLKFPIVYAIIVERYSFATYICMNVRQIRLTCIFINLHHLDFKRLQNQRNVNVWSTLNHNDIDIYIQCSHVFLSSFGKYISLTILFPWKRDKWKCCLSVSIAANIGQGEHAERLYAWWKKYLDPTLFTWYKLAADENSNTFGNLKIAWFNQQYAFL